MHNDEEKKCMNCGHGLCKAGDHCHNDVCALFYTPTKACYDTLPPLKKPELVIYNDPAEDNVCDGCQ